MCLFFLGLHPVHLLNLGDFHLVLSLPLLELSVHHHLHLFFQGLHFPLYIMKRAYLMCPRTGSFAWTWPPVPEFAARNSGPAVRTASLFLGSGHPSPCCSSCACTGSRLPRWHSGCIVRPSRVLALLLLLILYILWPLLGYWNYTMIISAFLDQLWWCHRSAQYYLFI